LEKASLSAATTATTKTNVVKDDINYDDDPLFYYEQNKSINFMKHFRPPNKNDNDGDDDDDDDEEEQLRQNNLNEIETTLNLESSNGLRMESEKNKKANNQYSHLDNLAFEDFNQDDEDDEDDENGFQNYNDNDDYNRNDYADADEDELGYFNINK